MKAGILAVGSELLGTDRLDTNSLRLTESLERYGVELVAKQVVGDDVDRIAAAVRQLAREAELVVVTGGLGPTTDDVTREAVALATERSLRPEPSIVDDIRRKFESFGRSMPEVNRRQAQVIDGAEVLDNRRGTAPGLQLEHDGTTFFLLPGVPRELEGIVQRRLEPWLAERGGRSGRHRRILRVACLPESEVEELLEPLYAERGEIGLLASPGDIKVRLASADEKELERLEAHARRCLGRAVYGSDDDELESVVGRRLERRGETLATAESCTGGWIAERLTAVPGSSAYFLGGIVAYHDRMKVEQLGVPPELIEQHGAVSGAVARTMAQGAVERLGSDWAVAVSGVAGPDGGTPEKPVGTVEIALARRGREAEGRRLQLPGDRRTVRLLTTQWALDTIRRQLEEGEG